MLTRKITSALLMPELEFSTSRSSGPGGQNVNKVNTKVTIRFNVLSSAILTGEEKDNIKNKLASRLTNDGDLILSAQEKRSQLQNKELILEKFDKVMASAFAKKKARKPTKPSKGAVNERIKKKKMHSEKKKSRKKNIE